MDLFSENSCIIGGIVRLTDIDEIVENAYDTIDISMAGWGYEEEYWEQCLGWSHSGFIYGRTGKKKIEVLSRFLERVEADTVILPDNVSRRHINRIAANDKIRVAMVGPNCKLFSMSGEVLMNKKGTKVVYTPKV